MTLGDEQDKDKGQAFVCYVVSAPLHKEKEKNRIEGNKDKGKRKNK